MKNKEKVLSALLFFLCPTLFVSSCESDSNGRDVQKEEAITAFRAKADSVIDKVTFLYFTDPHLLSYGNQFTDAIKSKFVSSFSPVGELFNILPLNFCLCGGDWLTDGDTQEVAAEKLLYADSQMKQLFGGKYYKMFGNHDTNYQGTVSETDPTRGDFSRDFIDKDYFSETGSAYYSFIEGNTEFYILDSGIDWNTELDDYRTEQLQWLSKQLEKSDCLHKAIGIHMFYNDVPVITPMAEELISICTAFNSRTHYKIDDDEYDFSDSRGVIHFVISGHCHAGFTEIVQGIPVIGTTCFYKETHPFDICILNYNTGYLDMIRVGEGEDRNVEMYMSKD